MFPARSLPIFRTIVRERIPSMITVLFAAALYAGWRITQSLADTVRSLPRRNEDMIFY
jgi:hypothetical protein